MSETLTRHTLLESSDETAQAQADIQTVTHVAKSEPTPDAVLFRPSQRPPIAILTVCDDGKRTGESIRIRKNVFQIGRSEGDLCLAHDDLVSARHVVITKQLNGKSPRLVIEDLESRNGLYFKVRKARLENQAEFLIGGGKYRFELPSEDSVDEPPHRKPVVETLPFETMPEIAAPALVELLAGGKTSTTLLLEPEYWIGRGETCRIRRESDIFTSKKHALLRCSKSGNWSIKNNKSVNGVWLKMPKATLEPGQNCEFRIGEQLFHLKFGV